MSPFKKHTAFIIPLTRSIMFERTTIAFSISVLVES